MKEFKIKALHEDLSRYEDEALENLRKDLPVYHELQKLNLTIAEVRLSLATLIDFQEDRHYCDHCPGLEACAKMYPQHIMVLRKEGHFVERDFAPCEKKEAKTEAESLYAFRDFPDDWLGKDLRTLDKSGTRKEAIAAMAKIAQGQSRQWLYLVGNHRCGKSYIAATFANTLGKRKGYRAMCFCQTDAMIDELKRLSFDDKKGFEALMQRLERTELLVLDGFGNEFKSDFVYSSILFPLIRSRAQEGRLTVFVSDFKIAEVVEMYSSKNIGAARAKQFKQLLQTQCGKEFDITSAPLY